VLELTKFNGFFKSNFDFFIERDIYGIYFVNNKLKSFTKLLYKKYPNLRKVIPYWKMGRISMEGVSTFMSKTKKENYSVPHFFMNLGLNNFYIHVCFEAKSISKKFVKVLKNNFKRRAEFIDLLKNAEGFMIEIDKVDFMIIGSKKNLYTTLANIWLNKEWSIDDIVEFIYTQMDKINNLPRGKFKTKKACFYLRKYIPINDPILARSDLVDEVYEIIQKLLPMYNFLLGIA